MIDPLQAIATLDATIADTVQRARALRFCAPILARSCRAGIDPLLDARLTHMTARDEAIVASFCAFLRVDQPSSLPFEGGEVAA